MTPPDHDHDVTRLYHEGSTDEPPAALDRAIVRAARESIAPAREARKPWWPRFALPLQLAVSVVLVTMLALTVDRNPPDIPAVTERAQPQPAPDAAALKAAPPMTNEAGRPPADQQAQEARPRLPAPRESSLPSPRAERKAEATPPATPLASPVPERSARASAEKAAAEDAAAPVGGRSLDAARAGPAAAGGAPAANRVDAARSPSDWLAAIERLAGAGEKTAARAELEAFRKAHPDYPVPERLEKLLAP